MENRIRNTSGDEPIGLNDGLIRNMEEEKNQDLHLDFWPVDLDRWWFYLLKKGYVWRRPDPVYVNGSQGR